MERVGLMGVGERADALLEALGLAGVEVLVWSPEGRGGASRELPEHARRVDGEALSETTLIFASVPIKNLRRWARQLGEWIDGMHVVVHVCRDLEPVTLKTVSEVLKEETPTHRFGALTGPMRLDDIREGRGASATIASLFPEVHHMVEDTLISSTFRLYRSEDVKGAEVAAALSRVMAMAGGVVDAMALGPSVSATLFARGLAEIARFVVFKGGFERTTFGMAGAGNLFADFYPPGSSEFQIGYDAVRSGRFDLEAMHSKYGYVALELQQLVRSMEVAAESAHLDLHILRACHRMATGKLGPAEAVAELMRLPVLYE